SHVGRSRTGKSSVVIASTARNSGAATNLRTALRRSRSCASGRDATTTSAFPWRSPAERPPRSWPRASSPAPRHAAFQAWRYQPNGQRGGGRSDHRVWGPVLTTPYNRIESHAGVPLGKEQAIAGSLATRERPRGTKRQQDIDTAGTATIVTSPGAMKVLENRLPEWHGRGRGCWCGRRRRRHRYITLLLPVHGC